MKLPLRHPVLPEARFAEAANRMHLSGEDFQRVLEGEAAFCDGRLWERDDFDSAFPEREFYECVGAIVCPEDLLVHELDVPRDVAQRLEPPIAPSEFTAVRVLSRQYRLEALEAIDAPAVIITNERRFLQRAFNVADPPNWSPMGEWMPGPLPQGAQGEPQQMPGFQLFGEPPASDHPVDAAFVGSSMLIQFPYASVVVGPDGAIQDAFATCSLRSVVCDGRYVLLTQGGGPTSWSGYFGAECFVRDLQTRAWLKGKLPSTLPPFVAGAIGGIKTSVVVDVSRGVGYPISPFSTSDMCGSTFISVCGEYAWDSGDFVLEASTGCPVLDVRDLRAELLCFTSTPDGWRFVIRDLRDHPDNVQPDEEVDAPTRLVDELGRTLRDFDDDVLAAAFSRDGRQLLQLKAGVLEVLTATDYRTIQSIDLRPLRPALTLPDESELWQRLASVYGIPAAVGASDLLSLEAGGDAADVQTRIHTDLRDAPPQEAIRSAIQQGRKCPSLSSQLPTKSV